MQELVRVIEGLVLNAFRHQRSLHERSVVEAQVRVKVLNAFRHQRSLHTE